MKVTIELTVEQARAIHKMAQTGIEEWREYRERFANVMSPDQINATDNVAELWDQAQYEIERALADVGGPT